MFDRIQGDKTLAIHKVYLNMCTNNLINITHAPLQHLVSDNNNQVKMPPLPKVALTQNSHDVKINIQAYKSNISRIYLMEVNIETNKFI